MEAKGEQSRTTDISGGVVEENFQFSLEVQDWVMRQQDRFQSMSSNYEGRMRKLESKIAARHREKAIMADKLEDQHDQISRVTSGIDTLHEELHDLQRKQTVLPQQLEHIRKEINATRDRQIELENALKSFEIGMQERIKRYRKELSSYEEVLGLHIETTPGSGVIRVTYTKVDPKDPSKEHWFSLRLEGDEYGIVDCKPEPEGLAAIRQDPRLQHDLSWTIQTMRQAFRAAY